MLQLVFRYGLDTPASLLGQSEKGRKGGQQQRRRNSRVFDTNRSGGMSPTGGSVQLQQLQHVASTLQREVIRHDGFVKELTMDDKGLVMVVGFGVPPCCRWAQDPVLGACEAALAIKSALKSYGQRCGIGITTGEVFCGTIGNSKRAEYSMIGSVVNLAARLMGAAAKHRKGIFMDRATKEVAVRDGLMECSFYDDLKVKGKLEMVPVWRLKSTRLKRVSRVSFDAEEHARDSMMDTLMKPMNQGDGGGGGGANAKETHSPPATNVRRRSYLYDTYDDLSDDDGDGRIPRQAVSEMVVGRCKLSSVYPLLINDGAGIRTPDLLIPAELIALESDWFQPLNPSLEKLVSKVCFFEMQLAPLRGGARARDGRHRGGDGGGGGGGGHRRRQQAGEASG
jgi:hypothetical protein